MHITGCMYALFSTYNDQMIALTKDLRAKSTLEIISSILITTVIQHNNKYLCCGSIILSIKNEIKNLLEHYILLTFNKI